MKNIQLIGFLLVVAGSFLPLVHVPVIGNWNYWKIDSSLAIMCWILAVVSLLGIVLNSIKATRISAIILIILFIFTIAAVKFKSLDFFSFLPFKSWANFAADMVKLKWGWLLEFSGAALLLLSKKD